MRDGEIDGMISGNSVRVSFALNQDCSKPECVGWNQISHGIIQDDTPGRVCCAGNLQSPQIGFGFGFAEKIHRMQVDHPLKTVAEMQDCQHPPGMRLICIGENPFGLRQAEQQSPNFGFRMKILFQGKIVNISQVLFYVYLIKML